MLGSFSKLAGSYCGSNRTLSPQNMFSEFFVHHFEFCWGVKAFGTGSLALK